MVSLSRTFPTSDNSFLLLDDSWERLHASPTNRRFPHQPFNKSIDFPKKHPRLHKSKRCKKQMFFVGTPNHFAWFFPNQPKTTKATDLVLKRLAFPRTRSPAISREIEVSEISKFGPDIMGIYTSFKTNMKPHRVEGWFRCFFPPGDGSGSMLVLWGHWGWPPPGVVLQECEERHNKKLSRPMRLSRKLRHIQWATGPLLPRVASYDSTRIALRLRPPKRYGPLGVNVCALNKALFPKGGRPLGEYSTLRFPDFFSTKPDS